MTTDFSSRARKREWLPLILILIGAAIVGAIFVINLVVMIIWPI